MPNGQDAVKGTFAYVAVSLSRDFRDPCQMGNTNRIRAFRKEAGMTLEGLAEATGLSESYLSRMEKGSRNVSLDKLGVIAEALGVPASRLVVSKSTVPLVGYVGAGATAHYYADGNGLDEEVDAPEGATENTVAVVVRGDSLGALFDHWLVFYDDVRDPPTTSMLGKLCVVGLADGRILVKQLKKGQLPGHFHLISNTEPPIYDAIVEWAAIVKQMTPR